MKKNKIRLTESQLHRLIKESVNKLLKEHHWDDNDFDEDDYDETVNYQYDENDEGDMFGMMFGGKEETIKNLRRAVVNNPNVENWNDKESYYAGSLLRMFKSGSNIQALQDMDITEDDIYYLWRTGNEERLKSLYYDEIGNYTVKKTKKPIKITSFDDYAGNRNDSLYFAHTGNDEYNFFKDGNIEMDRNLNVYDNGFKGKASLYAQKDGDEEDRDKAARNLGTTMRQSKQNYNKLSESKLHKIVENTLKKMLK